jgi:hypothetical protein
MRILIGIVVFGAILAVCQVTAQDTPLRELPDDYIPFTLRWIDGGLRGDSEYFEGFEVSMDIPRDAMPGGLSVDSLFAYVHRGGVTGTLVYPNGRTTEIEYEIVRHRKSDDIYMKSSLGYFLWEYLSVGDDEVQFAIYWWYCPPATQLDLEIIEMAANLIADAGHWHQEDDRDCDDDVDNRRWSLFCALKHASLEKAGEYNHRNSAIQTTRFVIDDLLPDHGFAHTLMDYNNAPSTTHGDVLRVLGLAKERLGKQLAESSPAR